MKPSHFVAALAVVLAVGLGAAKAPPQRPVKPPKKVKLPSALETRGRYLGVKMLRKVYDAKENRLTITYALANLSPTKAVESFTARIDTAPAPWNNFAYDVPTVSLKPWEVVSAELVIQYKADVLDDFVRLQQWSKIVEGVEIREGVVKYADGTERSGEEP